MNILQLTTASKDKEKHVVVSFQNSGNGHWYHLQDYLLCVTSFKNEYAVILHLHIYARTIYLLLVCCYTAYESSGVP